jgi:hypothetical protein
MSQNIVFIKKGVSLKPNEKIIYNAMKKYIELEITPDEWESYLSWKNKIVSYSSPALRMKSSLTLDDTKVEINFDPKNFSPIITAEDSDMFLVLEGSSVKKIKEFLEENK